MRLTGIILLLSISAIGLQAQLNTVYLSDHEAASQWRGNPAFQGNEKVFLYLFPGLSSIDLALGHTGFNYNSAVRGNTLQIDDVVDDLRDRNHLLLQSRLSLFALGFRIGDNQFRAGMDINNDLRFTYPGDFAELLWKGNGHPDVIGRVLDMSDFGINAFSYYDYFVGYSRTFIDDRLSIGFNLHYLQGLETIYTETSEFSLLTDAQDYALTASGQLDIRTSVPPDSVDIDEARYMPLQGAENTGFSFDLGAQYQFSDRLRFQASAMNVGSIEWVDDGRSFVLDGVSVTYEGLDLEDLYDDDADTEDALEATADSIANKFELDEIAGSFTTPMNSRYILSADYSIGRKSHVQMTYAHLRYFGLGFNSLTGMFRHDFGQLFSIQTGLQFFNFRHIMLPLSFQFNPGPVQLGLGTNNLIAPISYRSARFGSIHFSLSFRFGKDRKEPRGASPAGLD